MISIEVRYKLAGASRWRYRRPKPSQYFLVDPDSPGGTWTIDSVPKHNRIEQLLSLAETDRLEQAVTRVSSSGGKYLECAYHFWGNFEDYVCLVTRQRTAGVERELIFCGSMPFKTNGSQVVRVALDGTTPILTMNSFMWGPRGDDRSLDMRRPEEANKALKVRRAKRTRP